MRQHLPVPVHHATISRARTAPPALLRGTFGVSFGGASTVDTSRAALLNLARSSAGRSWPLDGDIAAARNAHRTNTADELQAALAGNYDWLEGDLRMRDGEVVLAHGASDRHALPLATWLAIGSAGGRGLKLDFKDARAIEPTRRLVQQAGVPDERLMLNVAIGGSGRARVSAGELRALRRAFPNAIINLDPGAAPYDDASIDRALRIAREVGGRVMFPLDAAHVSERIVRRFRAGGRVAIWNDPQHDPGDIARATKRLRDWGVNGMIDLRRFGPGART